MTSSTIVGMFLSVSVNAPPKSERAIPPNASRTRLPRLSIAAVAPWNAPMIPSLNGEISSTPNRAVAALNPPIEPVRVLRSLAIVPSNATVWPAIPLVPFKMPSARMSSACLAGTTPLEIMSRISVVVLPKWFPKMARAFTPASENCKISSPPIRFAVVI